MTRRDRELEALALGLVLVALTAFVAVVAARDGLDFGAKEAQGILGSVPGRLRVLVAGGSFRERLQEDRLELVLGRAAVAEAGMRAPRDHAAIWHALRRRAEARGVTIIEQARDYVSALKPSHRRTDRTRWVLELDDSGARPPSFPPHLLWDRCRGRRCTPRRRLWLATLVRARAFARGEVGDPCGATHWGAPDLEADVERARRAVRAGRWVLARCSRRTRNNFYRVVTR